MKTKQFFTTDFYNNPDLTLNVLNALVKEGHVADMEMYQNGTFLFMEVYENDKTNEILSPIISDLEAYKSYNNECFVSDETTQIGLCALQVEHSEVFHKDGKEIKWDTKAGCFVFSDDLM